MIKVSDNFDGEKFAAKYTPDFFVDASGNLVCAAYPNLTTGDIADCVVDGIRPATIEERLEAAELMIDLLLDTQQEAV